jgi:hypothetical protein
VTQEQPRECRHCTMQRHLPKDESDAIGQITKIRDAKLRNYFKCFLQKFCIVTFGKNFTKFHHFPKIGFAIFRIHRTRQNGKRLNASTKLMRILDSGIVSRDFVVCFLVSFDRSDISAHQERVLLLLKVRFRIEFFDFRVRP